MRLKVVVRLWTHSDPDQLSDRPQLQKLRRSLSFRTKSLRSKSADNFFQRPSSEVSASCSTGQLCTVGVSAPPRGSPPPTPPPLGLGGMPLTICSPSRAPRPPDPTAHTFLEHTFKKPHFCDICHHMIVGKITLAWGRGRGSGAIPSANHKLGTIRTGHHWE